MMKEYYVVYDQTPYDERGENYNFVGIGLQNNDAEMLKRHYDYSLANQEAGGFHPAKESEDSSHTIPPYPSVYDMPSKLPQILPVPIPEVDPAHDKNKTTPTNNTTPTNPPKPATNGSDSKSNNT